MWSKEEIDLLISNIDQYVKVLPVGVRCRPQSVFFFSIPTVCLCISGPRHRRPGRNHFRDDQRGEEGFLPLSGVGPQQAAVCRLQASSPHVRQQEPRWQVSRAGGDDKNTPRRRVLRLTFLFCFFSCLRYTPEEIEKLKA